MLHTATQELILKISEMTRQQKLVWSETSNGVFRYETEGYQVHITQNPIEVLLTDLSGREIERADSLELAETETVSGEPFTRVVGSLRKDVARQVRGTDAAIASILAGLDLDGPNAIEPVATTAIVAAETVKEIADEIVEETAVALDFEADTADVEPEPVEAPAVEAESETSTTADIEAVSHEENRWTDIGPEENDSKDELVDSLVGATAANSVGMAAVALASIEPDASGANETTKDLKDVEVSDEAADHTPSSTPIESADMPAVETLEQTLKIDAEAFTAAPVEHIGTPSEAITKQESGPEIASISETPQAQDVTETPEASFATQPVSVDKAVEQVTEIDAAGAGDQNDDGEVSAFGLGVTEFDTSPAVDATEPVLTQISSEIHFSGENTETMVEKTTDDDFAATETVETVQTIAPDFTPTSDTQAAPVLVEQDQIEESEASSFGSIGAFGAATATKAATQLDTPTETTIEAAIETTETASETAQEIVDTMTQDATEVSDTAINFATTATTGAGDLVDDVTKNIFGDSQSSIAGDIPEATTNPEEAKTDLAAAKKNYQTYNPWS